MSVGQLIILREARGSMDICQPTISSDLKGLIDRFRLSTLSEARDSLDLGLCQQASLELNDYFIRLAKIES